MTIATATMKNALATAYGTTAAYVALYSSSGATAAGTEPGAPYARQPITWGAAVAGVVSGTVTFSVPAGFSVAGAGFHTALTGGTYLDGGALTTQAFATAGTYTLAVSYTQS